jgi:hypothetical protein
VSKSFKVLLKNLFWLRFAELHSECLFLYYIRREITFLLSWPFYSVQKSILFIKKFCCELTSVALFSGALYVKNVLICSYVSKLQLYNKSKQSNVCVMCVKVSMSEWAKVSMLWVLVLLEPYTCYLFVFMCLIRL